MLRLTVSILLLLIMIQLGDSHGSDSGNSLIRNIGRKIGHIQKIADSSDSKDKSSSPSKSSIDPCEDVECMNGGNCVGDGVCNCTFGVGGPTCNMRVCDVTQCSERGGRCVLLRCTTDVDDCGGKQCNATNDEICLDDNCVDRSDNCTTIDDNQCNPRGEQCEDGGFCFISAKCINNACRIAPPCNGKSDGTACNAFKNFGGTCSDGGCLEQCQEDSQCFGSPCLGGFCADFKCGESACVCGGVFGCYDKK